MELSKAGTSDESKPDVLLLTMLDEIAWLTNLRGSDIEYNPVFEAYAAVFSDRAICFCHHPEANLSEYCPAWEFRPYGEYLIFLEELAEQETVKVWLDPLRYHNGYAPSFYSCPSFRKRKSRRFAEST